MRKILAFHSHLPAFELFSVQHLFTIGVIAALCLILVLLKKHLHWLRKPLAAVLFLSVMLQQLWLLYEGAWSAKRDLPLHLSDFAVLLTIMMLLTKSNVLFQFLYFAGIASSLQAIFTPDLGRFSFPHFQYIQFFISHSGVVLACLFMVVVLHYKPTLRSLWVTVLLLNLYAAVVFCVNKWLGANYLYIMKKPKGASLLDYLGPWPWYMLSMEGLMVVSFYLLYSPFWLKHLHKEKES